MTNLHDETNLKRNIVPTRSFESTAGAVPRMEINRYWAYHLEANDSIITKYWTGIRQSQRTCKNCKHTTFTFEPFDQLLVTVPKVRGDSVGVTLEDCLYETLKPELLGDYTCDKCNQKGYTSTLNCIARPPELLCIALNRFATNYQTMKTEKVSTVVEWDFNNIDLDAYVTRNLPGPQNYECFAIVTHVGSSIDQGHYYTYVRDPHDPFSQTWYCMNDSKVSVFETIKGKPSDRKIFGGKKHGTSPYMVYLRRKRPRLMAGEQHD